MSVYGREVIVRHLPWRQHRPYRVYYIDGLGRPVQIGNGWDSLDEATRWANYYRDPSLENRPWVSA